MIFYICKITVVFSAEHSSKQAEKDGKEIMQYLCGCSQQVGQQDKE